MDEDIFFKHYYLGYQYGEIRVYLTWIPAKFTRGKRRRVRRFNWFKRSKIRKVLNTLK